MTVYTTTQQGDLELAVQLTEATDIVTLNVTGATIQAEVTSVNGATGVVVLDTDDIAEGTTNLYYTDARATVNFDSNFLAADTDDLTEGNNNLYYTTGRFDDRLATKDTDNLTEGSSNLYYTAARANAAIDARVTGSFIEGLEYTMDGGTY